MSGSPPNKGLQLTGYRSFQTTRGERAGRSSEVALLPPRAVPFEIPEPLIERNVGKLLLALRHLAELPPLAEVAARLSTAARPLTLAEAAGLELADANQWIGSVRGEVLAPDSKGSSPLVARALHGIGP